MVEVQCLAQYILFNIPVTLFPFLLWITIAKILILVSQVSHHPMILACHCEGNGWKFYGDSNLKSKFWGRSIQLDPVGVLTLEFDDGEILQWSKV